MVFQDNPCQHCNVGILGRELRNIEPQQKFSCNKVQKKYVNICKKCVKRLSLASSCRRRNPMQNPRRRLGRAKPFSHGSWNCLIDAKGNQQNEINLFSVSGGTILWTSMGYPSCRLRRGVPKPSRRLGRAEALPFVQWLLAICGAASSFWWSGCKWGATRLCAWWHEVVQTSSGTRRLAQSPNWLVDGYRFNLWLPRLWLLNSARGCTGRLGHEKSYVPKWGEQIMNQQGERKKNQWGEQMMNQQGEGEKNQGPVTFTE